MDIGSTPVADVRSFPSRKSLLLIAVMAVFAVGALVAYGFASFAATTTTTTSSGTTSPGASSSNGTHICPNMGSYPGGSSSSSTTTG